MGNISIPQDLRALLQDNSLSAAVVAISKTGEELFFEGYGKVHEDGKIVDRGSIFWLSSMSKLITTLAILRCISEGQITLDEDATRFLPELASLPILYQSNTGKLCTKPRTTPITIRHLLTHQSGCGLAFLHPTLLQYAQENGLMIDVGNPIEYINSDLLDKVVTATLNRLPLCFEPGSGPFLYGSGFDWIGQLVSTLSGQPLETYVQNHICQPLGLTDTSMLFSEIPGTIEENWVRPKTYDTAAESFKTVAADLPRHGIASGSHGFYSSPSDFSKILSVILNSEIASKIGINESVWKEITEPQLINTDASGPESMYACMNGSVRHLFGVASLPATTTFDMGLGGAITKNDIDGMRNKSTYGWHGISNTLFWADREAGIAGAVLTNSFPTADDRLVALARWFEKKAYSTRSDSQIG
ncbi:beta-lactamase-type transpeptidase [Fusarium sporotrichioides]|uniref:Beta-lactamase-type transpeptidase n=1 Tax=Fusarium sporotrichioides TaxID=5514 RepID=A0A395S1U1_FUSSP|nr:beta-lactamase-type transpeptidase [Fusarium sporotrichioides]